MGNFTAVIFQEGRCYRVVVDGLGGGEARSIFEAEDVARRLIETHVVTSYPEREIPAPADAVGRMNFRIEIVRSDGTSERRELWFRVRASASRRSPARRARP